MPGDGFLWMTRVNDSAGGGAIKARDRPFADRAYVIVGAANSTATLVGQPAGGNQRGINGSAFIFVRLRKIKAPGMKAPSTGLSPGI